MAQRINYEFTCLECGRPIDEDDDGICSTCLDDGSMAKHLLHRFGQTDDGKRLSKRRRPKGHRPSRSNRTIEAVLPKVEVDRVRTGDKGVGRHQPGRGPGGRR